MVFETQDVIKKLFLYEKINYYSNFVDIQGVFEICAEILPTPLVKTTLNTQICFLKW